MPYPAPRQHFGAIDIYLFDQLLKGRITPEMTILDAGCGAGRNLVYFLREGYEVYGADQNPAAIAELRALAASLPTTNFRVEPIEAMSFEDASADVVICSAVLHFATGDAHFHAMLEGAWRKLKPGGLFFARLASSAGIEHQVEPMEGRVHRLPDGSERYLVDEAMLLVLTRQLGATLADPLKTTIVHGQRSMTTWVMRKNT